MTSEAPTLPEFLLARIAEDQADADAAVDDDPHWLHVGDGEIIQGDAQFSVSSGWMQLPHRREAAEHIARWDPARVLAECTAKRAIIAANHRAAVAATNMGKWEEGIMLGLDDAMLLLAGVYRDHPDFDPSWVLEGS